MQKVILRYGTLSGILMVALFVLAYFLGEENLDMALREVVGYLSIILSLTLIFLGMKSYRDSNGHLSYWTGFKTGLGISAIAGIFFGTYTYLLYKFITPDFFDEYAQHYLNEIQNSGQPPQIVEQQLAEMKASMESPLMQSLEFQAFLMFATVLMVGIIISLIAAGILQRKI